jgi:hypothetical protein
MASKWARGLLNSVYSKEHLAQIVNGTHVLPPGWCLTSGKSKVVHKRVCGKLQPDKARVFHYTSREDKAAFLAAEKRSECLRCSEFFQAEWSLPGPGQMGSGAGAAIGAGAIAAAVGALLGKAANTAVRTAARQVAGAATRNLLRKLR